MRTTLLTLFLIAVAACGCSKKHSEQLDLSPVSVINPATASSITGIVTFTGTPPKPQAIDMSQDPACAMAGVPANFGEAYAINKGHVQNVYVYIKDGLGNYRFPMPLTAVLDQRGCRYLPHVVGIMVGQQLRILNSDATMHNVHTSSQENIAWNLSQMPNSGPLDEKFTKTELMVPIECNQHPWMKMFLNVSAHPFYAITAADGSFKITGLPPGEYILAAVHEKMGEKTMKIKIGANEVKNADFKYTASDIP